MELVDRIGRVLKRISAAIEITAGGDPSGALLEIRGALTALKEEMLDAKDSALSMKQENLELKEQLRQVQRFETERHRYTAKTLETGSVVYVEKEVADGGGEPRSYLCAPCFESGQRSYLQAPGKREFYRDTFTCSACGYQAAVPNDLKAVAMTSGRKRAW